VHQCSQRIIAAPNPLKPSSFGHVRFALLLSQRLGSTRLGRERCIITVALLDNHLLWPGLGSLERFSYLVMLLRLGRDTVRGRAARWHDEAVCSFDNCKNVDFLQLYKSIDTNACSHECVRERVGDRVTE
jgi:hypothetical protein